MTPTPPHVVVVGIIESKPFCMLTTIHEDPFEEIEVEKKIWDPEKREKVPKKLARLKINDDYNHHMNGVDVVDQLAKNYEIGGPWWRRYKWTHAVSDDIIKRSVDAAFQLYKRRCELDEESRLAALASAPAGSPAAGSRARTAARPIKPMSHLDFIEQVAGGLIITAYNVQQGISEDAKLALSGPTAADPVHVLELFSRSHGTVRLGDEALRGAKRASPLSAVVSGESAVTGAGHCLLPCPSGQVNPRCVYPLCSYALANKPSACGKDSAYVQRARSKCAYQCPACQRAFHPECAMKYHGWGDYSLVCSPTHQDASNAPPRDSAAARKAAHRKGPAVARATSRPAVGTKAAASRRSTASSAKPPASKRARKA